MNDGIATTPEAPRRPLGRTGLRLSPLGLGCWQFSNGKGLVGKFWSTLSPEAIREIVDISLRGGINWFDTAEVYGGGQSEQQLARTLKQIGGEAADHAYIATKWWPVLRTSRSIPATIDERIRQLDNRTIHLYQVHQPYSFSSVASEMNEMAKLAKSGKIKHVGVSNFSAKSMREADRVLRGHGLRLASNQVKYNLLDRAIERNGILETAMELGVSIIAYSPLEQGLLSGKYHRNPELLKSLSGPRRWIPRFRSSGLRRTQPLIEAMEQLSLKYGASPTQVALNWILHRHGDVMFAIPGATKPHHAMENVRAMRFALTESELGMLGDLSDQVGK